MESRIEDVISKISRIMVRKAGCEGIRECIETVGKELATDGAVVMRTNEIPFLLEMRCVWDPRGCIADPKMMLDYSAHPEDELLNPFGKDEKTVIIEDVDASTELDPVSREFMTAIGAKAFLACSMMDNGDYIGGVCFYSGKPYVWKDQELELVRQAAEQMSFTVARIKLREQTQFLIEEINRRVDDADNAKARFVTNITNEMRTPLNSAMGMISIMRHNIESPDVMGECVGRMEILTRQLIGLVSECADMSMVSGSEHLINSVWIPLNSLVAGIRKFVDPLASARKHKIIFDYDPDTTVLVDDVKVARIIINAVTYSARYSPEDTSISVSLKTELLGSKHSMLIIRVRDKFGGYDPEVAARMFDPFAAGVGSGELTNIGINMAITRNMVGIMNGSTEFFYDATGTEFMASIPVEVRSDSADTAVNEEETSKDTDDYNEMYIGRRILLVEDNMMMGEILATLMGYRGLETDVVLNGREACDAYEKNDPFHYDMIFMDIQMPVMNGLEATKNIRNSRKADASIIPIIALSATSLTEDIQQALDAGMNTYLHKPVEETELFETINKYLI